MGPREHVPYQPQHQTGLKDVCVPTPTGDSLAPPPPCRPPDHSRKKLPPAWRWLPSRRASSQRLEGRGPSAWRPKPRLQMKFQLSGPPAVLPHSRTKLPERSLKRWPGVGSSRMGTLARQCSRRARVPILPSNTPSRSRFCSISEQPSAIHSKDHQINWLRPFSIRICKSSFSLVPPAVLPHSRTKLRPRIGDIVRHSVGKSCPALSSEPGLILLKAQVVRGSVGLGFVTLVVHPLAVPSEDRRRATNS